MNLWDWFAATTDVQTLISGLGLGSLAVLFATDRIITKGQHARRVADLVAGHAAVIAEKAARYDEMEESRDYWRAAWDAERSRADAATSVVADVAELAKTTNRFLEAFNEAAKGADDDR